eukprot:403360979
MDHKANQVPYQFFQKDNQQRVPLASQEQNNPFKSKQPAQNYSTIQTSNSPGPFLSNSSQSNSYGNQTNQIGSDQSHLEASNFNHTEHALDSFRRFDTGQTQQTLGNQRSLNTNMSGKVIDLSQMQPFNSIQNQSSFRNLNDSQSQQSNFQTNEIILDQTLNFQPNSFSPNMGQNFRDGFNGTFEDLEGIGQEPFEENQQTLQTQYNETVQNLSQNDSPNQQQNQYQYQDNPAYEINESQIQNDLQYENQEEEDNPGQNLEDCEYHQQIIQELVQDNNTLNLRIRQVQGKLQKTEAQLEKAKKWIRELDSMKNDITQLRKSAEGTQVLSQIDDSANLKLENEQLKLRLQELDVQNSQIQEIEDQKVQQERFKYERIINELTKENQENQEEQSIICNQVKLLEKQLEQYRVDIEQRTNQITNYEALLDKYQKSTVQNHQRDNSEGFMNQDAYSQFLNNKKTNKDKLASTIISNDNRIQNSGRTHSQLNSQNPPDYIALRNRSLSGDKGAHHIISQLNQDRDEDDYYLNQRQFSNLEEMEQQQTQEQRIKKHYNDAQYQLVKENINISNITMEQNLLNLLQPQKPKDPNYTQLETRCVKLEEYCRELFVALAGKIYDNQTQTQKSNSQIRKPLNSKAGNQAMDKSILNERGVSNSKPTRNQKILQSLRKPSSTLNQSRKELVPKDLNLSQYQSQDKLTSQNQQYESQDQSYRNTNANIQTQNSVRNSKQQLNLNQSVTIQHNSSNYFNIPQKSNGQNLNGAIRPYRRQESQNTQPSHLEQDSKLMMAMDELNDQLKHQGYDIIIKHVKGDIYQVNSSKPHHFKLEEPSHNVMIQIQDATNLDKQAYDHKQLNYLDEKLRGLVDQQYDFCQYKCVERSLTQVAECKAQCVRDVIVPFRYLNHMGRDQEDNIYRKCLADKFPNIKQEHYIECTNQIYKDRIKSIGAQFTNIAENILNELH